MRQPRHLGSVLFCAAVMAMAYSGKAVANPDTEDDGPLATVNGEPITSSHLVQYLGSMHEGMAESETMVAKPDPRALLERIIDVRLVLQEAVNIGLDELPEVQSQLEAGRIKVLRDAVIEHRLRDVTEGEPAVVEGIYREEVKHVRVESALFPTVEAASEFHTAVAGGADFTAEARRLIEQGRAQSPEGVQDLKASDLRQNVEQAMAALEVGQITSPVQINEGFTVIKLVDVIYPVDVAARQRAEKQALTIRQQLELNEYSEELRERYSKVDRELVDSLELDPGTTTLDELRQDDRIVARIEGADPITVADLMKGLEGKFFHGFERAVEQGKVREEIPGALDYLVLQQAAVLESERLGIRDSLSYKSSVMAMEEGLLFGVFVAKVVNPTIELTEDEMKAYYAENPADFTTPEMMRLGQLMFERREDAEAALERLRAGADSDWMSKHATGQVGPEDSKESWILSGPLLAVTSLPAEVQSALAGSSVGDVRFAEQPGGPYHVLLVEQVSPPTLRPFDEVEEDIRMKIFVRKRQAALDQWLSELRAASVIEVFVTDEQLRSMLGLEEGVGA